MRTHITLFTKLFQISIFMGALASCVPVGVKTSEVQFNTNPKTGNKNSTLFEQVNGLIKSNCIACHYGSQGAPGKISLYYNNEQELLDSGMVTPGVPLTSKLYKSVMAIDSVPMPPNGRLDNADLDLIKQYIESLAAPSVETLATFSLPKTYYDPMQVNVGYQCLATGTLKIRIIQTQQILKEVSVSCVSGGGNSKEENIPLSSIPGITAGAITVTLNNGNSELESIALSRTPSITTIPAAANQCAANTSTVPKFTLKRLSKAQILQIVKDVFAEFGVDASTQIAANANYLISDQIADSIINTDFYPSLDMMYSRQNINAIQSFFTNVVAQLEVNGSFKTQMVAAQCNGLTVANCANHIVDKFVVRLLRGQLSAGTISTIKSDAAAFPTAYDGIVGLLEFALLHPRFGFEIYWQDLGASPAAGDILDLTNEELFHKTFLTLFNTIPTAAQYSDWLLSGKSYDIYAQELIDNDAGMRAKFKQNVSSMITSWLNLSKTPIDTNTFKHELATLIPAHLQANFQSNSIDGFASLVAGLVSTGDLEMEELHFWDSARLAPLPFVGVLDFGQGSIPLGALPPFLFSWYDYNNIFKRGADVYKRLMCGDFAGLGQPAVLPLDEHTVTTTRSLFEGITPPNSSCFGCHQRFNGIGYNLEEYGVLGARRSDGFEYQYNANGSVKASHQIKIDAHLSYMNQFYHTPDFATLYRELYDKGVLRKCTTKQIGQYFLRLGDNSQNKCALEKVNSVPTNDVRGVILSILTSESFTKVKL